MSKNEKYPRRRKRKIAFTISSELQELIKGQVGKKRGNFNSRIRKSIFNTRFVRTKSNTKSRCNKTHL